MNRILKKDLDKYYHDISKALPCKESEKKVIMTTLKENVQFFLQANPTSDINDIYGHFGKVEEITAEYFVDGSNVVSKKSLRKSITITILVAIIICIICSSGFFMYIRSVVAAQAIDEITIENIR